MGGVFMNIAEVVLGGEGSACAATELPRLECLLLRVICGGGTSSDSALSVSPEAMWTRTRYKEVQYPALLRLDFGLSLIFDVGVEVRRGRNKDGCGDSGRYRYTVVP